MTPHAVPMWVAAIVVAAAVFGSALALLGSVGLVRLRSFYERAHPVTLGATLGATSILLAAFTYFSVLAGRPLPKALLAIVFIPLVNPVTTMLLARAALSRDRSAVPRTQRGQAVRGAAAEADAEWRRKAEELASAQAEAARRELADEAPTEPEAERRK